MTSYIKCSLPYFDPCSLLKIHFYLNVMLNKLISYSVFVQDHVSSRACLCKTSITRSRDSCVLFVCFVLVFSSLSVLCAPCCQFLWIIHSRLPLQLSLTFILTPFIHRVMQVLNSDNNVPLLFLLFT